MRWQSYSCDGRIANMSSGNDWDLAASIPRSRHNGDIRIFERYNYFIISCLWLYNCSDSGYSHRLCNIQGARCRAELFQTANTLSPILVPAVAVNDQIPVVEAWCHTRTRNVVGCCIVVEWQKPVSWRTIAVLDQNYPSRVGCPGKHVELEISLPREWQPN